MTSNQTPHLYNQRVFIIDDDRAVRDAMEMLLDANGLSHQSFRSAEHFIDFLDSLGNDVNTDSSPVPLTGVLVLDIRMPGMTGLELQATLLDRGCQLPIIFITGHGDIPMAVEAMRRGALDFLRKPILESTLIERIKHGLQSEADKEQQRINQSQIIAMVNSLSERERQVFEKVTAGDANKIIAADLDISERTVEVHRANVMKKCQAKTLADLVRLEIEYQLIHRNF